MKGFYVVIAVVILLCAGLPSVYAQSSPHTTLTNFRAVRVSTSTVSLSFVSQEKTIGKVEFTEEDGTAISLTDSVAQVDHLFTIEDLSSTRGYTFNVTATKGEITSYKYVVLLSPDSVGASGQSIVPAVNVFDDDGEKIHSTEGASTTPDKAYEPPVWSFVAAGVGLAGALLAQRFLIRRRTVR